MEGNMLDLAIKLIERNGIYDCELKTDKNKVCINGKMEDGLSVAITVVNTNHTSTTDVIVDLYYNKHLTQQEIAKALGVSQSTVSLKLKYYRYQKEIEELEDGIQQCSE